MTVKLDLPPEIEANLVAQARHRGLSLENYLHQILQEQNGIAPASALSTEEWIAEFQAWTSDFPDTPVLSDEALSREAMYPDRW